MELEYDQYDLEEKKRREKEIEDPLQYVNENVKLGWKDAKRQFLEIPREISRSITPDSWWEEIDKEIAATKIETRAVYDKMERYTQKQNKGAAFALNMAGGLARSFSNPVEMAVRKVNPGGLIANSLYDVAEYAYENKSIYNRNIFEEFNSMDAAQLSGRMLLNGVIATGQYQKKNLNLDINGKPIDADIRYKWREEYKEYFNEVSEKDAEFITDYMNRIRNGEKISSFNLKKMDKVAQRNLEKFYNDWQADKIPKLKAPEINIRDAEGVEPEPLKPIPIDNIQPKQDSIPFTGSKPALPGKPKILMLDWNGQKHEIDSGTFKVEVENSIENSIKKIDGLEETYFDETGFPGWKSKIKTEFNKMDLSFNINHEGDDWGMFLEEAREKVLKNEEWNNSVDRYVGTAEHHEKNAILRETYRIKGQEETFDANKHAYAYNDGLRILEIQEEMERGVPEDSIFYRGIRTDIFNQHYGNLVPGDYITDTGILSLTADPDYPDNFGDTIWKVLIPKGTKAVPTFFKNPGESEFVFAPGTTLKYLGKDIEGKYLFEHAGNDASKKNG